MSSDKTMKLNEPMMVLELLLRSATSDEVQRVVLEMNRAEAKTFVQKLKSIEKVSIMNESDSEF